MHIAGAQSVKSGHTGAAAFNQSGDTINEVSDGFRDSPEDDTGCNAAAKRNSKPVPFAHGGLCVRATDLDVADLLRHQNPHTDHDQNDRDDLIEPAKPTGG